MEACAGHVGGPVSSCSAVIAVAGQERAEDMMAPGPPALDAALPAPARMGINYCIQPLASAVLQEAEEDVPPGPPVLDKHAALRARLLARREEERQRRNSMADGSEAGPSAGRAPGGDGPPVPTDSEPEDPEDKWAIFN